MKPTTAPPVRGRECSGRAKGEAPRRRLRAEGGEGRVPERGGVTPALGWETFRYRARGSRPIARTHGPVPDIAESLGPPSPILRLRPMPNPSARRRRPRARRPPTPGTPPPATALSLLGRGPPPGPLSSLALTRPFPGLAEAKRGCRTDGTPKRPVCVPERRPTAHG